MNYLEILSMIKHYNNYIYIYIYTNELCEIQKLIKNYYDYIFIYIYINIYIYDINIY